MVFGILSLAATVPLLATSTVQLQNTAQETKDSNGQSASATKTNKCHLDVIPSSRMSSDVKKALAGRHLILKDGNLMLSPSRDQTGSNTSQYHKVTAYFLPFPGKQYDGLVTTIDDRNMLNWVYVDSDSYRVTFGTRAQAEKHLTGPMGLSILADSRSKVEMENWDGFMAVEDDAGEWSLYFDKDANGLSDKLDEANVRRTAQVELFRNMIE